MSTEDKAEVNALVFSYLKNIDPKTAEIFKKKTNATPPAKGSPTIAQVVSEFKTLTKRKSLFSADDSPAAKKPALTNGVLKKAEDSDSDSSSDDETPAVKTPAKPAATPNKGVKRPAESSSDDSSSEDDKPSVKTTAKPLTQVLKPAAKKDSSSDDSSSNYLSGVNLDTSYGRHQYI
uniref:LisH domain-containing protein n=1 Tax=Cacopsylla melanoneura TaxID=428564 RepID=A0A8D9ENJ3_9HEMI